MKKNIRSTHIENKVISSASAHKAAAQGICSAWFPPVPQPGLNSWMLSIWGKPSVLVLRSMEGDRAVWGYHGQGLWTRQVQEIYGTMHIAAVK